jgi:hypothetical protein
VTRKEDDYRREQTISNLVKAANVLVTQGKNHEALIYIGIAMVHLMHLAKEEGVELAYQTVKEMVESPD